MDSTANQEWKISILCAAVLLAIVFAFDSTQQQSLLQYKQEVVSSSVDLSLLPRETIVKRNKETTLSVDLNSTEDQVSGVELKVEFNPKIVNILGILQGDFFSNPTVLLNEIDNKEGKAIFTTVTLVPRSGEGKVAHLRIKGVESGTTAISLTEQTQLVTVGETNTRGSRTLGKTINSLVRVD